MNSDSLNHMPEESIKQRTLYKSQPALIKPGSVVWLCLAAPLLIWLAYVGQAFWQEITQESLPGQWAFLTCKLTGLMAAGLLFAQLGLALAKYLPGRPLPSANLRLHMSLGLGLILCMALHIGFFIYAVSVRTGDWPWHLLLPAFNHGFYRSALSLGALALMFFLLVLVSGFLLSRYFGQRLAQYECETQSEKKPAVARRLGLRIHWLAIPAAALGLVHAYLIGSEVWLLLGLATAICVLLAGRQLLSSPLANQSSLSADPALKTPSRIKK